MLVGVGTKRMVGVPLGVKERNAFGFETRPLMGNCWADQRSTERKAIVDDVLNIFKSGFHADRQSMHYGARTRLRQ